MHPSSVCSKDRSSQGGKSHKQGLLSPDGPATLLWTHIEIRLEKLSWICCLKIRIGFYSSLKPAHPTKDNQ